MDPQEFRRTTEALSIPEIRANIAKFVPNSGLASGALLTKDWGKEFTRALYRIVDLYDHGDPRNPDVDIMAQNATYTRALRHFGSVSPTFPSRAFRNLTSIQDLSDELTPDNARHIETLLEQNPDLEFVQLSFGQLGEHRFGRFLGLLSGRCHSLEEMHLYDLQISPNDIRVFFDLCSRLSIVGLSDVIVPHWWLNFLPTSFPRVHTLMLIGIRPLPPSDILRIIQKCPALQNLDIELTGACNTRDFGRVLSRSCPLLRRLSIVSRNLYRDCLYELYRNCTNLEHVDIPYTGFGERSFGALIPRHSSTLTHIDTMNTTFSSGNIQRVLETCNNLLHIRALSLEARHMVGSQTSHVPQGRWVCLGLKSFSVCIICLGNYHGYVFYQLSLLNRLEVLDVGKSMMMLPRDGITFKNELGLQTLGTLRQLRVLKFIGTRQQIGSAEAQLMLRMWKNLEEVHGILHTNRPQQLLALAVFKAKKVHVELVLPGLPA